MILHVTGDFPDPIVANKTEVIRRLLDLTSDRFSHRVISINRTGPTANQPVTRRIAFEYGEAWEYAAPPYGILHRTMLRRLGEQLHPEIETARPGLLWAHKLTIEGLAVAHAAREHQLPYGITIQGNTDLKILLARPDLRREFARIFHKAAAVVSFAPWSMERVESLLGKRSGEVRIIPCPTDLDVARASAAPGNGLVTMFHLANARGKNLAGIAGASRLLARGGKAPPIAIIGGGSEKDLALALKETRGSKNISFEGALSRNEVADRLNRASAFVMPSKRETFGLSFIEALFAGLPIIYPEGAAIDGFFDEHPFAIGVDPRDRTAIARAMDHVLGQEVELKQKVTKWHASAHARQFTRPEIADQFASVLHQALNAQ